MKRSQRRWLWLSLTVLILGLFFYNLSRSAEWRDFRWHSVWVSLIHARLGFLLTALLSTYASYLVRAYRWKFFLDPIKKSPSLWVLFVGQILGFSSIYLIGRPGEFVRPAYIARKEDVPISAMLAVLLLERIYDVVFMVLLFVVALEVIPLHPKTRRGMMILTEAHRGGVVLLLLMALVVVALVILRLRSEKLAAWLATTFRFLSPGARQWLKQIFRSFCDGLEVIRNWKDLVASLISTAILWIINTSVVWLAFQSLGGELVNLSWISSGLVLFFAAIGLLAQLPGVGGGYQGATILALTRIFGVKGQAATSAGLLLWIMMSAPCLALGLVLVAYEGLSFRKLGAIAKEERSALAQTQTQIRN